MELTTKCSFCRNADGLFCLICRRVTCDSCSSWRCANRHDIVLCKNCSPPQFCLSCNRCGRDVDCAQLEFFCEVCGNAICFDCLDGSFEQGVLKCVRCCGFPVVRLVEPGKVQPFVHKGFLSSIQIPLKVTVDHAVEIPSKYKNFKSKLPIGEGAQAVVYKCETEDGEIVACKEITSFGECNSEEEILISFEEQLKLSTYLMKLNHPHLIRYLDVIPSRNPLKLSVIMPFYSAGDLLQYVQRQVDRREPIPENRLCSLVLQIAEALKYLHTQSPPLMHLDVKPSNILVLDNKEQVILMDLESCRAVDASASVVRRANAPTYEYSAPELTRSSGTPKADIFSLGVVTFVLATFPDIPAALDERNESHMLCDGTAWTSATIKKAVNRAMSAVRGCKYSQRLKDLVGDMLATSPNDRPNMITVIEELTTIQEHNLLMNAVY